MASLDLTPGVLDLRLYVGSDDEILVSLGEGSFSDWTSPSARWRPERGSGAVVAFDVTASGDDLLVSITRAMKTLMSTVGYWELEAVNAASKARTLLTGEVLLHDEVGL